ncbi:MAG TPA: thiamine-phosphate kinase [Gemmatimonadaceae bacterium]|nr:thiamine-phosphate kinase [Gemmatimonadaceae bacterium]
MTDAAPRAHLPLGSGGEFDAIRAMLRVWGTNATGIGDDAALLTVPAGESLVVSTDASFEGVHFRREWLTPREIGARAAAAALSDLAAMAATPIGLLLALGIPSNWRGELDELARGVGELAAAAACPIVGGNVTRAGELSLTITVLGSSARPLTRAGARPGDVLYVTGMLGGPGAALDAFLSGARPRDVERARFAAPRPRLAEARWLVERDATAAIDISDGLVADARHLAAASAVRVALDVASLPCIEGISPERAASSGEEYELLVAVPPRARVDVEAFSARFGMPLTLVGHVSEGEGVSVDRSGDRVDLFFGHDHLS